MIRILYFSFIFFILQSDNVFAQDKDSSQSGYELLDKTKVFKENTDAIDKKLYEIGKKSITNRKEKEEAFLQLKAESENLNYDNGVFHSSSDLMSLYIIGNENVKAIKLASQLKTKMLNKKDTNGYISNILRLSGMAYCYVGLYDIGRKDFIKAMQYAKNIEDCDIQFYILSQCFENMTMVYNFKKSENKKFEDSILYAHHKSLELAKQISDNSVRIIKKDKFDAIAFNYIRLGIFYLEKQNLNPAQKNLMQALRIYHTNENYIFPTSRAMLMNQLSWLYLEKKDYKKVIEFANHALKLEKQFHDPYHRMESYEFLTDAYRELGKKEKSGEYFAQYSYLKDSLNIAQIKNTNATVKNIVYEIDKDKKNEKRTLWFSFVAIFLAAVFIIYIVLRRRNKVLKKNYEQIIHNLKNEPLNNLFPKKEAVSHPRNKNNINSETEKKILAHLDVFEKSDLFLKKDISISFLASEFNTNNKYLSEVIKKSKGENFNNYINYLRINYITRKLYQEPKYREYKLSSLADDCGFSSPQVFIIAFKKIHGVTPYYFIENLKKEQKQNE